MDDSTISIFGNKNLLEILKEIRIFTKFKFKYYYHIESWIKALQLKNNLPIFFITESNKDLFAKANIKKFPLILVNNNSILKNDLHSDFYEKLNIPFTIQDLEKKIILLIAKNIYKKNSLINLNGYIIDKNERKIKKDNLELKLSEKEINFLVLFTKINKPITKKIVLKSVWKYSSETETHTVETHIHRLRKKIFEKFNDNNFIKNNNKGYFI